MNDLRLKPSRRPLVIGAAIILIVLAVVIAMTIGGSGGNVNTGAGSSPGPNAATPGSDLGQQPVEADAGATPAVADAGATSAVATVGLDAAEPAPADESITIKVDSDPKGANVLLSGKVLGTTPLDIKIKKGIGRAFLTVQRALYQDVTTKIDLAGDFSQEVTLKKLDDKDDEKKKADEERRKQEKLAEAKLAETKRIEELKRQQAETKRVEELKRQQADAKRAEELKRQQAEAKRAEELKQREAKKVKCQPPHQINPYDTSCLGQPGASATGACPPCKEFK